MEAAGREQAGREQAGRSTDRRSRERFRHDLITTGHERRSAPVKWYQFSVTSGKNLKLKTPTKWPGFCNFLH